MEVRLRELCDEKSSRKECLIRVETELYKWTFGTINTRDGINYKYEKRFVIWRVKDKSIETKQCNGDHFKGGECVCFQRGFTSTAQVRKF